MLFTEERLNIGIVEGTTSTITFKEQTLKQGDGSEHRHSKCYAPLQQWQLGDRSNLQDELIYINNFYSRMKKLGSAFRFRDWLDYQGTSEALGTGNGVKTNYQLLKQYGTYASPIKKPVSSTVKIYLDGIQTNSFSVDLTTGIITFNSAPSNGVVITADYEFDKPVEFGEDNITNRLQIYIPDSDAVIFLLNNLTLKEVRLA